MQDIAYKGKELELFQHATVWKKYFSHFLRPYLKGRILEAGAGMGSTTQFLCDGSQDEWVCMEPDPDLFQRLQNKILQKQLPSCCTDFKGTIQDLANEVFDVILYIDVIEHIENDVAELKAASNLLSRDGYLLVLVPAYQSVYSPFDESIGHFRRYNKKKLLSAAPSDLVLERIFYLDSVGLFASIFNKYFLKQSYPTGKQIELWDKVFVRISKISDFLIQ